MRSRTGGGSNVKLDDVASTSASETVATGEIRIRIGISDGLAQGAKSVSGGEVIGWYSP